MILLIAGYLFISELEKERREEEEERYERTEKLQNYLKETIQIQKAIYTAVRKGNEALGQQLKKVCDDMPSGLAAEEEQKLLQNIAAAQERAVSESKRLAELQVNALKAVAKYNKENARQLAVNANENAERITAGISHLEASIECKIDDFVTKRNTEQGTAVYQNVSQNPAAGFSQELPVTGTSSAPGKNIAEAEDKLRLPEPADELLSEPLPADSNQPISPDEIEAMLASLGGEELEDEDINIPIPDLTAQLQPEIGEEPKHAPEQERKPAVPATDDPNHTMTSDEIAALIASMTQ